MRTCLTRESTTFPKAAPMITATARSITFPLRAKSLNSSTSENAFGSAGASGRWLGPEVGFERLLNGLVGPELLVVGGGQQEAVVGRLDLPDPVRRGVRAGALVPCYSVASAAGSSGPSS